MTTRGIFAQATGAAQLVLLTLSAGTVLAADEAEQDDGAIAEITVEATRVANTRPAGTFATPATLLRFDPLTELQSRGLPEGQADVTVRGGLFENTGFRLGAVTIMDPQTGHYVAELPVAPAALTPPDLLTSIDNAISGFNSTIATVGYSIRRLETGGALTLGVGSDELTFGSVRAARRWAGTADAGFALGFSAAASSGDGSVANGDHEFGRINLHGQRTTVRAQSDLLLAYQDKFYGWPGAYTGFASLAETDDTQTTFALASHRVETDGGAWEVTGFYRRLVDDYDFNRTTSESGEPGSFDHETRVYGLGFDTAHQRGATTWQIAGQLTADDLVRSTDLTNSDFTTRRYGRLSVVPTRNFDRGDGRNLSLRLGGTFDLSNRDDNEVSPLLGATFEQVTTSHVRSIGIEFARTTQVPGYTVLASNPDGLFGGNPALGREAADQILLAVRHDAFDWHLNVNAFLRRDDDLVDWTFSSESPTARQANPVDIDVRGIELLYGRELGAVRLNLGYTWLDKDADYGDAAVDASFYALNFAQHRATFALRYDISDRLELLLDTEYRDQEENALRASADQAFIVAATLAWRGDRGFGVALTADNLTDDDYQQFPGTPAVGRQVSLRASYDW